MAVNKIDRDFTKQMAGFRWNRRTKTAYFDVRDPSGGRKREFMTFDSVEDARKEFVKFREEVKKSAVVGAPKTFRQFYDAHWQSMRGKTKDRTFKNDTKIIETHVLPFFSEDRYSKLTEVRIEEFVSAAKAKGTSAPTINYALRMLRKLMHGMRKRKYLYDVPTMPFEKERTLRNEFNAEETDAYLGAFDNETGFMAYLDENRVYGNEATCERYSEARRFGGSLKPDSDGAKVYFSRFRASKTWFLIALHTGLRRGDITSLQWSSINFAEGFIRVTVEKTGREATVPMSETLRKALTSVKASSQSPYVVVTPEGKRYADSVINRYHRIALSIAGITRRVRVHDLRHSFGSALASAGASELMLKDFFGHESTKMVQRYSRPSAAALRLVASALDRTPDGQNGHGIGHGSVIWRKQSIRKQQAKKNKATVSSGLDSFASGAVDRT